MGSKRFKGKVCAYCAIRPSATGDHVFAREFFLKSHRDDLPQAPICDQCNNEKSKLEHYLTTILPFGGRHAAARESLETQVPGRLKNNRRLQHEISTEVVDVNLIADSVESKTIAIPIKGQTLENLVEMMVKGLSWYHWDIYLDDRARVEVWSVTSEGSKFFQEEYFSLRAARRIWNNVGDGAFIYEGVQAFDNPAIAAWRFRIYGGILLVGDDGATAAELTALSGPSEILRGDGQL